MSTTPSAKLRVLLIVEHHGDVFLLREMVNEEPHSRFVIGAEAGSLADATTRLATGWRRSPRFGKPPRPCLSWC